MPSHSERALLYLPGPLEGTPKLTAVLVQMGVRVVPVPPEQVHQSVGFLAGRPDCAPAGPPKDGGPVPAHPVLIFCGFSSSRLDEALSKLRAAGAPPIPHKAVLTEHNRDWSLSSLYGELCREREEMAKQRRKPV